MFFYISLVFESARRVLSQTNTRLRLLYLLHILYIIYSLILYHPFLSLQVSTVNLEVLRVNPILVKTTVLAASMVTGRTARVQIVGPVLTAMSTSMNVAHHHVEIWASATTRQVAITARA